MTLIGQAVLLVEGVRGAARATGARGASAPLDRRALRAGRRSWAALLIGLSTFQAEFDFGVPQFRLVFQPMLIALAAGRRAGRRADLVGPRRRARRRRVLPRRSAARSR